MSNPDRDDEATDAGTPVQRDLTDEQLASAPILESVDVLLIDELTEDEDEAFAAALGS